MQGAQAAAWRYALAGMFVTLALWFRSSLYNLIGTDSPFMIFAPAALLAARFGGLGPGIAATAAGLVLGDYFFTPPRHSWGPYEVPQLVQIGTYGITTMVGVLLFHYLKISKEKLESAVEEARQRGAKLEREIIERRQAELSLARAQAELRHYANVLESRVSDRTAKLQDSLRSLESVLYHVAHDLRAPLRAMHSFAELLNENYASHLDSQGAEYATRISMSARNMDRLLQDLLEYGHVCQVEIIEAQIDLASLIEGVATKFAGQLQRSGGEIVINRPLACARGDRHLLELALTHVVANAVKFAAPDKKPRVAIWTEVRDDVVRVWVEDGGIGIEPAHHERVFRIFEQITRDRDQPGTGIGLAIVKKAMQRMGGDAGLESTVGVGTRVWLEMSVESCWPTAEPRPLSDRERRNLSAGVPLLGDLVVSN